jgi:hypothetical protein
MHEVALIKIIFELLNANKVKIHGAYDCDLFSHCTENINNNSVK